METPELTGIEQVASGWLKKYILTYKLPNGKDKTYECVSRKGPEEFEREMRGNALRSAAFLEGGAAAVESADVPQPAVADAVSIAAVTQDNQLVMIREFRYPLNSWCIALPAGLVDAGEEIEEAVDRELREETGYAVRRDVAEAVRPLPQPGFSSAGMTDETVHVVFVQVEHAGEAQPEPSEFIETFLLPLAEVPQFLEQNKLPLETRAQLVLEMFAR